MRVVVLAPIATSLYSRLVTHALSCEPGVDVAAVIVRSPWSLRRLRSEFRRDGAHLIRKIAQKMVLGDARFEGNESDGRDTMLGLARELGLPGRSLLELAKTLGVPLVVCDDHNSDRAVRALARSAPDVVAFTGGGLLRHAVLSVPRLGVLNCHPGMLPAYRGMDVVEWTALESRVADPGIGLSVHFMDRGLDTGPILSTHRTPLRAGDDFATIRRRMERDVILRLLQTVRDLRDGTAKPRPQEAGAGRQYYVMHPTLLSLARRRLEMQLPGGD